MKKGTEKCLAVYAAVMILSKSHCILIRSLFIQGIL